MPGDRKGGRMGRGGFRGGGGGRMDHYRFVEIFDEYFRLRIDRSFVAS